MTIFLIIMIPVSGFLGFMICAILQVASHADRMEERYFAEEEQKKAAETQENKEADS